MLCTSFSQNMETLSDSNKQNAPEKGWLMYIHALNYLYIFYWILDKMYFKQSNICNAAITSSTSDHATDNPVYS